MHPLVIVLGLLVFALPAVLFSRIVRRAGYSPWWALLGLVPVIGVVALWVFAFLDWPQPNDARA
ncbi:hypothetical protein IP84_07655 [beta proteobacterium AAP99]|nr:hypothetical protein IP84_07655 [beta proteobacterium AAP99]